MSDARFDEKIIYKTHQHWIILVVNALKFILYFALPSGVIAFFFSELSWLWAFSVFFLIAIGVVIYDHYLWNHSWLMIGNQKITLTVRKGIFSQYAMNIRYRNIRDSAVSKNSMFGYLLKFGTLFVRSSANEGDFQAHFVPKVGKVYALVNALSRYSDDERAHITTIEELHHLHQEKEFSQKEKSNMNLEEALSTIRSLPGVIDAVDLSELAIEYIKDHEEVKNRGISEVISRKYILALTHDHNFRDPPASIVKYTAAGEVYFPGVAFPEVIGKNVISASPSAPVHEYLLQFFPYHEEDEATILVGWD